MHEKQTIYKLDMCDVFTKNIILYNNTTCSFLIFRGCSFEALNLLEIIGQCLSQGNTIKGPTKDSCWMNSLVLLTICLI